jgi:hypothetical protein
MDPIEFLELAEELVERKTPCGCRAAIGRAYYGVLNAAGKLIRDAGLSVPEGPAAHQKTWFDFINSGIQELQEAGSELSELHGQRIEADYRMTRPAPDTYKHAKYCVTVAREHIETLKRHFEPSTRARTIAAITDYRRRAGTPV